MRSHVDDVTTTPVLHVKSSAIDCHPTSKENICAYLVNNVTSSKDKFLPGVWNSAMKVLVPLNEKAALIDGDVPASLTKASCMSDISCSVPPVLPRPSFSLGLELTTPPECNVPSEGAVTYESLLAIEEQQIDVTDDDSIAAICNDDDLDISTNIPSCDQEAREASRAAQKVSLGFRDVNPDEEQAVREGGKRNSADVDAWARRRFDAWRCHVDLPCEETIEVLYERDVRHLVELFSRFFLQVQKVDGMLYPPETLTGLFRGLGRIIRSHIEARALESGESGLAFNILRDPRFRKVTVSCEAAIKRSGALGISRKRKVTNGLTYSDEANMLNQEFMSSSDTKGCSMRVAFYCTRNFCVRGHSELYGLMDSDFDFGSDRLGEYIRFDERTSKNHKLDVLHCQPEKLRFPVTWFVDRPEWKSDEPAPHPLFLRAKDGHLKDSGVWYSRARIGLKTISKWLKDMVLDSGGDGLGISNKSPRVTAINRCNRMGVPIEVGMRLTGHKSREAYMRYDKDNDGIYERALQNVVSGVPGTGGDIFWEAALAFEIERHKVIHKEFGSNVVVHVSSAALNTVSCTIPESTQHSTLPLKEVVAVESSISHVGGDDYFFSVDTLSEIDRAIAAYKAKSSSNSVITNTSIGQHGSFTNCTINVTVADLAAGADFLKNKQLS